MSIRFRTTIQSRTQAHAYIYTDYGCDYNCPDITTDAHQPTARQIRRRGSRLSTTRAYTPSSFPLPSSTASPGTTGWQGGVGVLAWSGVALCGVGAGVAGWWRDVGVVRQGDGCGGGAEWYAACGLGHDIGVPLDRRVSASTECEYGPLLPRIRVRVRLRLVLVPSVVVAYSASPLRPTLAPTLVVSSPSLLVARNLGSRMLSHTHALVSTLPIVPSPSPPPLRPLSPSCCSLSLSTLPPILTLIFTLPRSPCPRPPFPTLAPSSSFPLTLLLAAFAPSPFFVVSSFFPTSHSLMFPLLRLSPSLADIPV
ncbi:hypothetical protein C8R45DRAFT_1212263 [Mycena sanguinolenta]|nr:hypothetical protein C8R45DRAFT_1212263 [Mycena sanguinolenta]